MLSVARYANPILSRLYSTISKEVIPTTQVTPATLEKACKVPFVQLSKYSQTSRFIRNAKYLKEIRFDRDRFEKITSSELIEYLRLYKEAGVDLSTIKVDSVSLLKFSLTFKNQIEPSWYYQTFLELDSHIDLSEYEYGSPLHDIIASDASKEIKLSAIRALLEKELVNVNLKNKNNDTPLSLALACEGNYPFLEELIELLFDYGAIFDSKSHTMQASLEKIIRLEILEGKRQPSKVMQILQENDKYP